MTDKILQRTQMVVFLLCAVVVTEFALLAIMASDADYCRQNISPEMTCYEYSLTGFLKHTF